MNQQHLRRRTTGPGADEAGVAHPGGVEHQEVAGGDEVEEIAE